MESKYKLSEIIDELAEKKPQKPTKNIGSATPAHRHGRRSAAVASFSCSLHICKCSIMSRTNIEVYVTKLRYQREVSYR